jgi:hypothetical protein
MQLRPERWQQHRAPTYLNQIQKEMTQMSNNSEIQALKDRIAKLQEMEAESEKARLATIERQITERKLAEERAAAEAQAEFDRRVALREAERRKAKELQDKIEAERKFQDMQLEMARNAAEVKERERRAEQSEMARLTALAYQHEMELKRREAELYQLQSQSPLTKKQDTVVTIQSPSHPLSVIFGNSRPDVPEPAPQPATAPVQQKKYNPTSADVSTLISEFPVSSKPSTSEVIELLKLWPLADALKGISLFRDSWSRNGLASGYAIEQLTNYLVNTPAGDSK